MVGSMRKPRIAGNLPANPVSECFQGDRGYTSIGANNDTSPEVGGIYRHPAPSSIDAWRGRTEVPQYDALLNVLDRFELPRYAANHVLELMQESLIQSQEVLANTNLARSEKRVWLQVLREQVCETLRGMLGPKCFAAYYQACGSWIDRLEGEQKSGNRKIENVETEKLERHTH